MGKRNKRARTILKRMSILGEVPSLETARRYGVEKEVQAELDHRQSIIDEENKIKAEAEEKARKEAEAKAEAEKKRKAEAAKKKKAAAKKKAAVKEKSED